MAVVLRLLTRIWLTGRKDGDADHECFWGWSHRLRAAAFGCRGRQGCQGQCASSVAALLRRQLAAIFVGINFIFYVDVPSLMLSATTCSSACAIDHVSCFLFSFLIPISLHNISCPRLLIKCCHRCCHGVVSVWAAASPTRSTDGRRWCVPLWMITRTVCGCWSMPGPISRPREMCASFGSFPSSLWLYSSCCFIFINFFSE